MSLPLNGVNSPGLTRWPKFARPASTGLPAMSNRKHASKLPQASDRGNQAWRCRSEASIALHELPATRAGKPVIDRAVRNALCACSVAFLWVSSAGQAAWAESDLVLRGRKLANLVCSVCHVVSEDKDQVPILRNPGPPFAAVAARPSITEATLRDFLVTKHREMGPTGQMPNPRLADYQIDELVAYILSLSHHS